MPLCRVELYGINEWMNVDCEARAWNVNAMWNFLAPHNDAACLLVVFYNCFSNEQRITIMKQWAWGCNCNKNKFNKI